MSDSPTIRLTPEAYGKAFAERLFAGRKGHGGAPVIYMQLKQADVANIAAAAFEFGQSQASPRPSSACLAQQTEATPATPDARLAALRAIWNEQDLRGASPGVMDWARRMAKAISDLEAACG